MSASTKVDDESSSKKHAQNSSAKEDERADQVDAVQTGPVKRRASEESEQETPKYIMFSSQFRTFLDEY